MQPCAPFCSVYLVTVSLQWGNCLIWTLNLGGNFGPNETNAPIEHVKRLTKINRSHAYQVRLMLSMLMVYSNPASHEGAAPDGTMETAYVSGFRLSPGLYRAFLDDGLRRFYAELEDVQSSQVQQGQHRQ